MKDSRATNYKRKSYFSVAPHTSLLAGCFLYFGEFESENHWCNDAEKPVEIIGEISDF